ncbi:hypothetical protein MKZ38_007054 [Zalerion maritima]|uniref:Uncharacterized protein n=1 Tax=Zalerion maritima TaxID=339359 RepID=A0AAD5WWN0_9PEZI|nr:hypothetical protein MKZ38_007054 [Zalerion maritima]
MEASPLFRAPSNWQREAETALVGHPLLLLPIEKDSSGPRAQLVHEGGAKPAPFGKPVANLKGPTLAKHPASGSIYIAVSARAPDKSKANTRTQGADRLRDIALATGTPLRSKRPAPAEFARTSDLLQCLGDHVIHDRNLLYSLCVTCKRLNLIFTPFLDTEVTIDTRWSSLSLINLEIGMSLERWGLPATLTNNPGLQYLALSAWEASLPRVCLAYRNHSWCTYLFNSLSDRYYKLSETPLALKSLHLGLGFVPQNRAFGTARLSAEAALKQLTDLSMLGEFHIDNRCMRARQRRQGVYIRSTERVYDLVSVSTMPKLKRLSIFKEDSEFIQWWRWTAEGDFFRRLSISFAIPPRMELVDETISTWCGSFSDDMLAGLHQTPRMLEISFAAYQWKREDVMATKLHILDELAASGGHVEGLFIWLGEDWLDALKMEGAHCLVGRRGLDATLASKPQRRELAKRPVERVSHVEYLMVFPDVWWVTYERELIPLTQDEIQDIELVKNPLKPSPDLVAPEFWSQGLRPMWLGNRADGDLVLDKK